MGNYESKTITFSCKPDCIDPGQECGKCIAAKVCKYQDQTVAYSTGGYIYGDAMILVDNHNHEWPQQPVSLLQPIKLKEMPAASPGSFGNTITISAEPPSFEDLRKNIKVAFADTMGQIKPRGV